MKITRKLMITFLLLGLTPCVVVGAVVVHRASDGLAREAYNRLEQLRQSKAMQMDGLVATWQADLGALLEFADYINVAPGTPDANRVGRYLVGTLIPHGYRALHIFDGGGRHVLSTDTRSETDGSAGADPRLRRILDETIRTRGFVFADFALNGDGTVSGLIARPALRDEEVVRILVLEVPSETVNAIMPPPATLGETGEAYLVGPDNLPRSDSGVGPSRRSVADSFRDPRANRIDTQATRESLAGVTGTRLISDYRGRRVLSAFTPVRVGDVVWSLIVEIDEAEAFAAVADMRRVIVLVSLLGIAAALAGGLWMSRALSRPIVSLTDAMNRLAGGDDAAVIPARERADEIGEMARAVIIFKENAREISRLQAGQALGERFFDSVLAYLCGTLGTDGAWVGIIEGGVMNTIAVRHRGHPAPNQSFPCDGTSCEATMRQGHQTVLIGATAAFPDDPIIRDWRAESLIALALLDSKGCPFGAIAVLSSRPVAQKEQALALLRLFASRVAAELERKEYEEDLLRSLRDLREAQERAERAVREARLADEAKTRFLAAASHDLRQPVQSLNLFVAALRNTEDPERRRFLTDQIEVALAAMGNLLGSLLDISKLDAGLVVPEVTDVPLAAVFGELSQEFAPVLDEKHLSLRVVSCRCVIRSDRVLLTNILRNLLANAVRYTPEGQRILMGCRIRGGRAAISVADTGRGITPEQLPLIFQEFYQVDNPARDRTQGLGLGLSIVKKLAALLGHQVEVSSKPDKGSIFTLVVPLAEPGSANGGQPNASRPQSGVADTGGDGHVRRQPN